MSSVSLTAKAIRRGLLAAAATTVATSGFISTSAIAAEEQVQKVERIAVTGSRIKRTDMETASPVSVIDASSIIASGATSIDDVLQKMTSSGGAMTNAAASTCRCMSCSTCLAALWWPGWSR